MQWLHACCASGWSICIRECNVFRARARAGARIGPRAMIVVVMVVMVWTGEGRGRKMGVTKRLASSWLF